MPRLSVEPDSDRIPDDATPRPTIRLSWAQFGLGAAVAIVFFVGDILLPGWLGIDLDCLHGEYRRRAALVEIAICSVEAGPRGLLFLAWLAAPIALFGWWLRRALGHASKQGRG